MVAQPAPGSNPEGIVDAHVMKDFFGETEAEERQFAHVEGMIQSFMKPI